MPFAGLDRAAIARALSQIADRPEDRAEAFFEYTEEVALGPREDPPGLSWRRELGLSLRLVRDQRSWVASRDGISSRQFAEALRQVARVLPRAGYPEPQIEAAPPPEPPSAAELAELPGLLERAIRAHRAAFPLRLTTRRHHRSVQVITTGPVPEVERETFYSIRAELPWGRFGNLATSLDEEAAEILARSLVASFRARHAASPDAGVTTAVLSPAAAAVLLHEVVAHTLEADVLARGGNPEAAVGVTLGLPHLSVLDDPTAAPAPVRRATDDEGSPVRRRWLLREGVVAEPLADTRWAERSALFTPGAGRRGDRHGLPGPRSFHLELLPGETTEEGLIAQADGGIHVTAVTRGRLDPQTGAFCLELPFARRIRGGTLADAVGPCQLVGTVADLLARIDAVAGEPVVAGAGWCAKDGQKLPVWATTPALRITGVDLRPLARRS
jgi:predicted Zn-dependent protease